VPNGVIDGFSNWLIDRFTIAGHPSIRFQGEMHDPTDKPQKQIHILKL